MLLLINIISFLLSSVIAQNENILCQGYCADTSCSTDITDCDIQNSTKRGIWLPSPETCNCCPYCLPYLAEGDPCTEGSPDGSMVSEICGEGLSCIDEQCSRMTTECYLMQDEFDERMKNGTAGTMEEKPNCDGRGFYDSYKCIPGQTCYCVDKNGERIFGESDFTDIPQMLLKCECSRNYYEVIKVTGDLNPRQHFRCQANGDYDAVQCIGDNCLCVDTTDGTPSDLDATLVNITEIRELLDCYDPKIHTANYYKSCELKYMDILDEIQSYEDLGYSMVLSLQFPNCDIDGTYAPVQQNSSHKFCSDSDGNVLTAVKIDQTGAEDMDCKCVRAVNIMSSKEVPQCLENGNYNPKQCRRGRCRCVDSDGNQICKIEGSCPDFDENDSIDCTESKF